VSDPKSYGVVAFDGDEPVSIEEKPANPKSSYAVTGLYFYDAQSSTSRVPQASARGELEISDVNRVYLNVASCASRSWARRRLAGHGTHDSLLEASDFISASSTSGLKWPVPKR